MRSIQEIEEAIQQLSPDEFSKLARWFRAMDQERWERQIDSDASTGKLDFLFEEAEQEKKHGLLKTWPQTS